MGQMGDHFLRSLSPLPNLASSIPFQANSEEFIPIFANNPRELKAFLEHMSEVQPDSPQGIYDTLLELRLQNWAHEKDPQVRAGHNCQRNVLSSFSTLSCYDLKPPSSSGLPQGGGSV